MTPTVAPVSRSAPGHLPRMDNRKAGVLFGVDGTLFDTNYLHVLAWWRA